MTGEPVLKKLRPAWIARVACCASDGAFNRFLGPK